MHLNKFIAHAGVCSRRKAAELIKTGFVKVNGKTEKNPSYQVQKTDAVKVQGKLIVREEPIYILVNKPKGVVTTVSDEKGRQTVIDLLGNKIKERLYPVGRLDINTTGLLLLTNDGQLAQRLAHPKYEVKKDYAVTLNKPITQKDCMIIKKGIRLPDGLVQVDAVTPPYGQEKNQVRVTLHSGKYRIIRRIFEMLGYYVDRLDRIKYAGISKRGLPLGGWRYLTSKELSKITGK